MFIIFLKQNNEIISYGSGTTTESGGKLYLGPNVVCNDLSICGWKYIADQVLECDADGAYVYDSDHYDAITPPPSLQEQIDALLELVT